MSKTIYIKTELTGGTVDALDGINGSLLNNEDLALVCVSNMFYVYLNNNNSTMTESNPTIIVPDNNPSNNRWYLQVNNTQTAY
jgi:hypothetical protein